MRSQACSDLLYEAHNGNSMEFQFECTRIDKIPIETALTQLERVAELRGFVEFGKCEFDATAPISSSTAVRAFGTWSKAMEALRDTLRQRGLALTPRRKGYFAEAELFAEMERIWTTLGHRPSRIEWEAAQPRIGYQTYKRYFGGWQQACLTFLEQRTGEPLSTMVGQAMSAGEAPQKQAIRQGAARNPREVSPGLRLKVYERDRF